MNRLTTCLVTLVSAVSVSFGRGDSLPLPKDDLPPTLDLHAIPFGLDKERPIPADNPLTDAKVRLGRKLFFDPILSADGTVSCASCHQPQHGFAGPGSVAVGIGGKKLTRNAPSLLNRAFGKAFFWDGRETTLEGQALRPIDTAEEMGGGFDKVIGRLRQHPEYPGLFRSAFGEERISQANLARALASFERVLLSGNTRVDRFRAGELEALNDVERHGLWLYESRARCWRCHKGANFTDESFHNTGVGWGKQPADLGRFAYTKKEEDRGLFKTPSLRGLKATAPYMHDGSLATLEDVLEFYNRGGEKNPSLSPLMEPLKLTKQESMALVAFLKALSDPAPASRK